MVRRAAEQGINIRKLDDDSVAISCDELTTLDILDQASCRRAGPPHTNDLCMAGLGDVPDDLRRTSEYLTPGVFNRYHTDPRSLMRYMPGSLTATLRLTGP